MQFSYSLFSPAPRKLLPPHTLETSPWVWRNVPPARVWVYRRRRSRRMSVVKASDRLIVALDFSDVAQARALVATLGDSVSFYKIGMELAYGGTADNGFALADELAREGQENLPRSQAARHSQYGAARDGADRAPGRRFSHGSCFSADDGGGQEPARQAAISSCSR